MLDAGALPRLVWEFQAAPETVAVGGIVRIVNGSQLEDGRLLKVRTPRNLLANLQIIEYLRAFLGGRIGWSKSGMLLIISGAFGLFRRDVCVEVGGYDPTTVGEDAELVLRLHRHQRDQRQALPDHLLPRPDLLDRVPGGPAHAGPPARPLAARPDRDDRPPQGDAVPPPLRAHRLRGDALLHPLRAARADDRVLRLHLFVLALVLGIVSLPFALVFFAVSLTYSLVLSFLVILMEERAFRRYPGWSDLTRLTLTTVVENFGYRQMLALVRMRSWYTLARRKQHWGEMTRKGFGPLLPGGVGTAVPGLDPTADPVLAGETPAER